MHNAAAGLKERDGRISQPHFSARGLPGLFTSPSAPTNTPNDTASNSVMAGASAWKTILFPALLALTLYLLSIYVLIPLYRRQQSLRARYAQYMPLNLPTLPFSSRPSTSNRTWFSWLLNSRRRDSQSFMDDDDGDLDGLFSDEELEEGIISREEAFVDRPRRLGRARSNEPKPERRLSRDLEVGFRDDSDSDSEDELGGEEDGCKIRDTRGRGG